jgi:hypothetical protein
VLGVNVHQVVQGLGAGKNALAGPGFELRQAAFLVAVRKKQHQRLYGRVGLGVLHHVVIVQAG